MPGKDVGVVLHRDGRVRVQRLGPDPQPEPEWRVEEFDLVTDQSWGAAFTDPACINEFHSKADRLEVALGLMAEAVEDGRLGRKLAAEFEAFIAEQEEKK